MCHEQFGTDGGKCAGREDDAGNGPLSPCQRDDAMTFDTGAHDHPRSGLVARLADCPTSGAAPIIGDDSLDPADRITVGFDLAPESIRGREA